MLHRFFIAISCGVVNDGGAAGTAPHSQVWSAGALPKMHAFRDVALLLGPEAIWESDWVGVLPTSITADDVCHCPYSVGILVKLVAFLGTFQWPAPAADLRGGGVYFVELLILYELCAGKRLVLEKAFAQFQCRLFFLVQALIFGLLATSLVV